MGVHTDQKTRNPVRKPVTVDLQLTGALVARAGARQARVAVSDGRTLGDVVRAWGEEYGNHVRFALLENGRLRTDTVAYRITDGAEEPLAATADVRNGDTVEFRMRE